MTNPAGAPTPGPDPASSAVTATLKKIPRRTFWRRVGGSVAIGAALGLGLVSSLTHGARVCEWVHKERVCRALTLTDPPIVGFGVVGGLLFAPDAGELGLFGLVSWKRKVDQTAKAQTRLDGEQKELSEKLIQLQALLVQSQSQNQNQHVEVHNYDREDFRASDSSILEASREVKGRTETLND